MPFESGSIRFFGMVNVFHHVADVPSFLREAVRCLCSGGRLLIVDQHLGWISKPVLRYLHHEPFDAEAAEWRFASTGPLSGANGALAWIVFVRDREKFAREYPQLRLRRYCPFSPLTYWLAGGLKSWSLSPGAKAASLIDRALLSISKDFGSFVEIELVRE
jgi:SAM-dependent methyltransferase